MPNRYSDETPIADAVEQHQETAPESAIPDRREPPVEADPADWHDQLHEVVGSDDDDRQDDRQ